MESDPSDLDHHFLVAQVTVEILNCDADGDEESIEMLYLNQGSRNSTASRTISLEAGDNQVVIKLFVATYALAGEDKAFYDNPSFGGSALVNYEVNFKVGLEP